MLEWVDVWKVVLGFASSLVLIWIKELLVHHRKLLGLRKSLWSMMEFESDLEDFLSTLDRIKTSISDGNLRLVAFSVPRGITSAAEELARLEPESAYIYNDLLSHAEIVRDGISSLRELIQSLLSLSPGAENEDLLRRAIVGQASILKGDRIDLAQSELRLLKYIKSRHGRLNQSTLDRLETSLAKFKKDEYDKLFHEQVDPKRGG